jgi:hypothetical protein
MQEVAAQRHVEPRSRETFLHSLFKGAQSLGRSPFGNCGFPLGRHQAGAESAVGHEPDASRSVELARGAHAQSGINNYLRDGGCAEILGAQCALLRLDEKLAALAHIDVDVLPTLREYGDNGGMARSARSAGDEQVDSDRNLVR